MATMRIPLRLFASTSAQPLNVLRNRAAFLAASQHVRLHSSESLPRIAQASTWKAILPKSMRDSLSRDRQTKKATKSKEWNPATFYIIIFTLIGSQAINLLLLKKDYAAYSRSADAKIRLLKEVIEKIKNGEKVDVERLLGTGDAQKEREWEEVLREIEAEDSLWHQKKSEKEVQASAETQKIVQEQSEKPAKRGITSFFFRTKSPEKEENKVEEKKEDNTNGKNQPRKPVFF